MTAMRLMTALLCCGLCLGPRWDAAADVLDKATCDGLKDEQTKLSAAGVTDAMHRGPEWAKANLPEEKLKMVARWIDIEEQINFRCRRGKMTAAAARAGAAAEEIENPRPPVTAPATTAAKPEAGAAQEKPPVKADEAKSVAPKAGNTTGAAKPQKPASRKK